MKYRYVITNEGTVEADTEAEARNEAFVALDQSLGVFECEVELLTGDGRDEE